MIFFRAQIQSALSVSVVAGASQIRIVFRMPSGREVAMMATSVPPPTPAAPAPLVACGSLRGPPAGAVRRRVGALLAGAGTVPDSAAFGSGGFSSCAKGLLLRPAESSG